MKLVSAFALVIPAVLLFGCPKSGGPGPAPADLGNTSPAGLGAALEALVGKKDPEALRWVCTEEGWSTVDGCRDLGEEALRKDFVLALGRVDVGSDPARAVLLLQIVHRGQAVDGLFGFAVRDEEGRWLLDGISEQGELPRYFLEGALPARFSVEDLPGNPELDRMAGDIAGQWAAWSGGGVPEPEPMLREAFGVISSLGAPRPGSTHESGAVGRSVIVLTNDEGDSVSLYFMGSEEGRLLYEAHMGPPRVRSFLRPEREIQQWMRELDGEDADEGGYVGAPVPAPDLDELYARVESSTAEPNYERFQELCTPEFWLAQEDSGLRLMEQVMNKDFRLVYVEHREADEGDRGVLTHDVVLNEGDRLVDRVYLYALRGEGGWLLDGVDENEGHIPLFLEGRVEARYDIRMLPDDPALEGWGRALLERAAAAEAAGELGGGPGGDEVLERVGRLDAPTLWARHWDDALGRGAVQIKAADGEELWIYLVRDADGSLRAYDTTYAFPSERSFFRDPAKP